MILLSRMIVGDRRGRPVSKLCTAPEHRGPAPPEYRTAPESCSLPGDHGGAPAMHRASELHSDLNMSFLCKHKLPGSPHFCGLGRPENAPCGAFEYVRVERPEELPPADPRVVDVAVLDMNHGWPNLGHDCLAHSLLDISCELLPLAEETGVRVRAISFDVRRSGMIPEPPGGRF